MLPAKQTCYWETPACTIIFEDGIATVSVKQESFEFSVKDHQDIARLLLREFGMRKIPVIFVLNKYTTFSNEFKAYYATLLAGFNIDSEAIVAPSLSTNIQVNFFLKVHKPKRPAKMFSTLAEATEFVQEQVFTEMV